MDILEISVKVAIIYIPFLFALCFHEVAHGWVAKRLGDNTASLMGRLTLNPAAHADPLGTYVLPIAGIVMGVGFFGWAKPVPVNERNLRHPKRDMFLISAAGPASNVLLAVIAAVILVLANRAALETGNRAFMLEFAQSFVLTNMMLAIFNLIPVPPLDGAKVLAPFLPDSVNDQLEANQAMISMILLFVLLSGVVSLWPVIKFSSEVLISSVMWVL